MGSSWVHDPIIHIFHGFHGNIMEISWKYHGNIMEISWVSFSSNIRSSWKYHGMGLLNTKDNDFRGPRWYPVFDPYRTGKEHRTGRSSQSENQSKSSKSDPSNPSYPNLILTNIQMFIKKMHKSAGLWLRSPTQDIKALIPPPLPSTANRLMPDVAEIEIQNGHCQACSKNLSKLRKILTNHPHKLYFYGDFWNFYINW